MKLGEILKCAKAGVSTEDVKAIQALDNVSVDDALDLIKAGYKAEDLKELVTDEEPQPKDEEPTPKDEETKIPPEDEEKKRLQTELDKAKKDLEQAQLNNTKKDVGTGEKPNTERELEKLFAEL